MSLPADFGGEKCLGGFRGASLSLHILLAHRRLMGRDAGAMDGSWVLDEMWAGPAGSIVTLW